MIPFIRKGENSTGSSFLLGQIPLIVAKTGHFRTLGDREKHPAAIASYPQTPLTLLLPTFRDPGQVPSEDCNPQEKSPLEPEGMGGSTEREIATIVCVGLCYIFVSL